LEHIPGFLGEVSVPDDEKLGIKEVPRHHAKGEKQLAQVVKLPVPDEIFEAQPRNPEAREEHQARQGAIEGAHEEVGPEKSAVPVGVQGHDQVDGEESDKERVQDGVDGGKDGLGAARVRTPGRRGRVPLVFKVLKTQVVPDREVEKAQGQGRQKEKRQAVPGEEEPRVQPGRFLGDRFANPGEKLVLSQVKQPEKDERQGKKGCRGLGQALDGSPPAGMGDGQNGRNKNRSQGQSRPEEKVHQVGLPGPLHLVSRDSHPKGRRSRQHQAPGQGDPF